MCRRSVHLLSFALALTLILTSATRADLVGWWRFDEGSGDTASDSSGNGHDGTLLGTPEWGPGAQGNAVVLDPDGCYGIDCGVFDPTDGTGQFSLALWAFWDGTGTFQHFLTKSKGWGATTMMMQVELWGAHTNASYTDKVGISHQAPGSVAFFVMPKNEWVHLAFTFDGSELRVYLNGVDEMGPKPFSIGPNVDAMVEIGYTSTRPSNIYRTFEGRLDEVRIYSHALSPIEVLSAMKGEPWPWAFGPDPADGALHPNTWANLGWSAGDFAVSHDVYLGDNFDDVNNGTEDTFRVNQGGTSLIVGLVGFPCPDGLVPGTTYYWRIDEVNDADPNSPWKGDVWSFSIPPKTAYYPDPADRAEYVDLNAELSWKAGYETKLHTIYFSENFDDVNDGIGGVPRGTTTYTPGPLELAGTYYWRVDEFDGFNNYEGKVWSFTTVGTIGNPNPPDGAVNVNPVQILTWDPGIFAASHEVYFGTDPAAVKDANKASLEYRATELLGGESYDPGKLALDTTYYWRIDEVNSVNADSPWTGRVWSFSTGNFLVVDDFESYNDIELPQPGSNTIFDSWVDGFNTTTNGALTSNDFPPYAEQTVVHGGIQSMPYRYDTNLKICESTKTLVYPRDWTEDGVTRLVLWFQGDSANTAERMFLALNGAAVVYHDDPGAAQKSAWTKWEIDLSRFADQGVNLTNVNTITIGFGTKNIPAAGGLGKVYFDDIRLYLPEAGN